MSTGTADNKRGSQVALALRRIRLAGLIGVLLIGAAVGVRVWWARGAPERARKQAAVRQAMAVERQWKEAKDAVAARPNDPQAHNQLALVLFSTGAVEEALASWRQGHAVATDDPVAWQNLANGYLLLKRYAAADETYQQMLKRWPKNGVAWQGLAVIYRQQGQYRRALEAAEKAIRLAPEDPNNYYVAGAVAEEIGERLAFPQAHYGMLEKGEQRLTRAAASLPEHPDVHYRLGRIYLLIRRYDDANRALERAVQLSPQRTVAWLALAEARTRKGQVDGAIAAARQAYQVGPLEPEAPLALGRTLLLKNDPKALQEAVDAFTRAVQLRPESAECHDRLGTALMRIGRLPEARTAFERAFELEPSNPYPVQQLAQIYQRQGETRLAAAAAKDASVLAHNESLLRQLQRTSSAHPENPRIHLALAKRYLELNWLPQAEDQFLITLAILPKSQEARQGLARTRQLMAQSAQP